MFGNDAEKEITTNNMHGSHSLHDVISKKHIPPPFFFVLVYNYNYILLLFGWVGTCLVCRVSERNLRTPDRLLLQLLVLGKKNEEESVIVDPNFLSCFIFLFRKERNGVSARREFPAFDYYYLSFLKKKNKMLFTRLPINT